MYFRVEGLKTHELRALFLVQIDVIQYSSLEPFTTANFDLLLFIFTNFLRTGIVLNTKEKVKTLVLILLRHLKQKYYPSTLHTIL